MSEYVIHYIEIKRRQNKLLSVVLFLMYIAVLLRKQANVSRLTFVCYLVTENTL